MTDRYIGFVVLLEKPIRQDDFDVSIGTALNCLKGVKKVKPILQEGNYELARMSAKEEIYTKLFEMFREDKHR